MKKTGQASEQDHPDVRARHQAWRESEPRRNAACLVFIDETEAKTDIARSRGRAPRTCS